MVVEFGKFIPHRIAHLPKFGRETRPTTSGDTLPTSANEFPPADWVLAEAVEPIPFDHADIVIGHEKLLADCGITLEDLKQIPHEGLTRFWTDKGLFGIWTDKRTIITPRIYSFH